MKKEDCGKKFQDGVNKCAKFMEETVLDLKKVTEDATKDKSLVTFFEVLIKIILLVIGIQVIKVPVFLLSEGGKFLLTFLFYPFDFYLSILWEFILSVAYLIISIYMAYLMFKNYYDVDKVEEKKEKEDKKKEFNLLSILIKVFIYIVLIIPLIFINLGIIILFALACLLIYKGVEVIGLALLLFGFSALTFFITRYVTDALDNRYKKHTFLFIVGLLFTIVGVVWTIADFMRFDYPDTMEGSIILPNYDSEIIEIDKATKITNLAGDFTFEVDESLNDNELLLEIEYYDKYYDVVVKKESYNEKQDLIYISTREDDLDVGVGFEFLECALEDMKDHKIYNYHKLSRANIIARGNSNTEKLVYYKEGK